MGLLDCASGNSIWRGYDYHKENKVVSLIKTDAGCYSGAVKGSNGTLYNVNIDVEHPRKSACDCPFADGKRIVCKHQIALYFTAFPNEAERVYKESLEYEKEEEKRQEEIQRRIEVCVHKMKKSELENTVLQLLYEGPEWQYDRFVRDNLDIRDLYE